MTPHEKDGLQDLAGDLARVGEAFLAAYLFVFTFAVWYVAAALALHAAGASAWELPAAGVGVVMGGSSTAGLLLAARRAAGVST